MTTLHYNARLMLANGQSEKIGKAVNARLAEPVLCWNPETDQVEAHAPIDWHASPGPVIFHQVVTGGGKSGKQHLPMAGHGRVWTPSGARCVDTLAIGDELWSRRKDYRFNDDQCQLLYGSCLGDGSIRPVGTHTASFRFGHGAKQRAYLEWKHAMLSPLAGDIAVRGPGNGFFDVLACPYALAMHKHLYGPNGRTVTAEHLARMDARALAVWYMDDGTFHGSFEHWGNGRAMICNTAMDAEGRGASLDFFERLGLGRPHLRPNGFSFLSTQTRAFHHLIAPYVHPTLDYKLHPEVRGRFAWPANPSLGTDWVDCLGPTTVVDYYPKPETRGRLGFSLTMPRNLPFFVDGVLVQG